MALTQYTAATNIIGSLGTTPEDRPGMTDQQLKDKFDENAVNIKAYINGTLKTDVDLKAYAADLASTDNGKGASLIGLEDSAGRFSATQIEAALAEIVGASRTTETVKSAYDAATVATGQYKVGSITHDLTVAGDQAVTGVGFQPKSVLFLTTVPAAAGKMSIGAGTSSTENVALSDSYNFSANTYTADTYCINIVESSGNSTRARIKTLDSGGFTLTWVKIGTGATGTATALYLAVR